MDNTVGDLALPGVLVAEEGHGWLVVVDMPGVTGGGRLVRAGDQLRGVVQLQVGPVSATGLAIIGRHPDNLLVLLAAEFRPGIPLPYGVMLQGIGGVVGSQRRPGVLRLREVMASGDLGRLLFPGEAAAADGRAMALVAECFPVSDGSWVVGPTLKLGWPAKPTVMSASFGLLVSDRDVTVLGRLAVGLPTVDTAVVRLEANVLGRADSNGLAIDATLVNSHIAGLPLEGDIRLRMLTAGGGQFALSAGGFHPAFPPPPGMADMRRIGTRLSMGGGVLRARLEAYLAVTTNSYQFGARMELWVGLKGWGIHGHCAYDVLLQVNPFGFAVGFDAMVSIRAFGRDFAGVGLSVQLSGPAPWRISGRAWISLPIIGRIRVPFPSLTLGGEAHQPPPRVADPVQELVRELGRPENWSVTAAPASPVARLHPLPGRGRAAVAPWARFAFHQHRVPLEVELSRMDGLPLPGRLTLRVTPPGRRELRDESFVRQQFFEVDDADRLAGAGYDRFPAGFALPPPQRVSSDRAEPVSSARETYVCRGGRSELVGPPVAPEPPGPTGLSSRALRVLVRSAHRGWLRGAPPVRLKRRSVAL